MAIETIPNRHPEISTVVTLSTPVVAICPRSKEPKEGSFIAVTYSPKEKLIELHSVEKYLVELSKGSDPLDLETLVHFVVIACGEAVGKVSVKAVYKLRNGLEMTCESHN